VNAKTLANKSDSGNRGLQNVIISNGVASYGITTALSTTPNIVKTMYEVDPNTSSSWVPSSINAITAGYVISE